MGNWIDSKTQESQRFRFEFYVSFFLLNWQFESMILRTFLSFHPSVDNGVGRFPLTFCAVTQSPSFLESLCDSRARRWSVPCLPVSPWSGGRGGSSSRRHRSEEKNSFYMKQGWKLKMFHLNCFSCLTQSRSYSLWQYNQGYGGLSVLFSLLYYEDVVVSKWMIPKITIWSGNLIFQKEAEWPSHCLLQYLSVP